MDREVVLYAALSLDGYLAEKDGGVDFLDNLPEPAPDVGYQSFYEGVGALVMGGKTYRQITATLAPDSWPYKGKPSYVYSRSPLEEGPEIIRTDLPPKQLLYKIKKNTRGNIWVVGGGEIAAIFMAEGLIDRYMLYWVPVLLGGGIPLFPPGFPPSLLKLEAARPLGPLVETVYTKREG